MIKSVSIRLALQSDLPNKLIWTTPWNWSNGYQERRCITNDGMKEKRVMKEAEEEEEEESRVCKGQ
jgi:hypothetical protein